MKVAEKKELLDAQCSVIGMHRNWCGDWNHSTSGISISVWTEGRKVHCTAKRGNVERTAETPHGAVLALLATEKEEADAKAATGTSLFRRLKDAAG